MSAIESDHPTPESNAAGDEPTWRSWILPIVLGVLLLALLATSAVLFLDRREESSVESAVRPADIGSEATGSAPAQLAVARARQAVRVYFTLDYASVTSDMDRLRDLSTPAFVEEYDEMAPALSRRVTSQRLRLSASLPANGVATEYLSANTAQILVSVDVTTRRGDTRSTGSYRARVLLEWVGREWLVASVDEVA